MAIPPASTLIKLLAWRFRLTLTNWKGRMRSLKSRPQRTPVEHLESRRLLAATNVLQADVVTVEAGDPNLTLDMTRFIDDPDFRARWRAR